MKQRFTFILAVLLSAFSSLSAQSVAVLTIPDVVAAEGTTEICVPVVADTFINIVTVQFSLAWDTTQVEFVELRLGDNPYNFDGMFSSMPTNDNIGISFIPGSATGATLAPGTVLFEACFNTVLAEGFSTITFDGFLPPEFAQDDGTFMAGPSTVYPGSITYGNDAAVSVLPGDTNGDDQVDHLDVLNIGYIFGTTGPARMGVNTSFSAQVASIWSGTFLGGQNYAEADASGNGTIDLEDLEVVRANYDLAVNNSFSPAPDVSSATGPALSLATEAVINAGERTTITINLGNGNNPNAVGYALAVALEFDPAFVDLNSVNVNYDGSFLGDDLLTVDKLSTNTTGRLEIVASRKDQINTTTPGGKFCTVSFIPLNPSGATSFPVVFRVAPNAFVRADQSSAAINGGVETVDVQDPSAIREPSWAAALNVFPNPYTNGPLFIRGELPAFDAVKVLDQNGRLLINRVGNARQLDLETLPAGTYLLQIEAAGEIVNRKVMKQ